MTHPSKYGFTDRATRRERDRHENAMARIAADDEGCEDPHCPGWLVSTDLEIERCDTCDVMSDDEAKAAAMDWLHNEWTNNRTRARMRRETRPK